MLATQPHISNTHINLQKPASDLVYKYWIRRSFQMTQNQLPGVGGTFEFSETRRAYQNLSLLGPLLIRTFPYDNLFLADLFLLKPFLIRTSEISLFNIGQLISCSTILLCLNDTCFFPRPELRQHLALYTLHKTPKDGASPSGPPNMIT